MQRVLHPQLIAYEGHVPGDEAKEQGEKRVKRNLGIRRRGPGLKAFSVGNDKKRTDVHNRIKALREPTWYHGKSISKPTLLWF